MTDVIPGLANTDFGSDVQRLVAPRVSVTGLAVPIDLVKIPLEGSTAVTLADLSAKGVFLPQIQDGDLVGFAALALGMDPKGKNGLAWPRETRTLFSPADHQITVFVNWRPKAKTKATVAAHFYDVDNKELWQPLVAKINFQPDQFPSTLWTVPLSGFAPGIYRIDVCLGDVPVWREFFRIVP